MTATSVTRRVQPMTARSCWDFGSLIFRNPRHTAPGLSLCPNHGPERGAVG